MSFRRQLSKVLFCLFLAFASLSGGPMDPKQVEEILHIMNQTKIEVVVTEKNSSNDPELPIFPPEPPQTE
jgi:hypothetical protein